MPTTNPKYFKITAKQLRVFESEIFRAGYTLFEEAGDERVWRKPGAPTHTFRNFPFPMISLNLGERD